MATPTPKPLKVLFHLHPSVDTLDFTGPLEILTSATHSGRHAGMHAFEPTVTAVTEHVTSGHKCIFRRHIPIEVAYSRLAEFDILVIPGGSTPGVLNGNMEPLDLIRAWCALGKEEGRTRTLFSICTGSLFLSKAGALKGLTAATHVDARQTLREMSHGETTVVEERFVVNKVNSNGLRVITSGGVTCGLDASIWLVSDVAGKESAERVLHSIEYAAREGIIV